MTTQISEKDFVLRAIKRLRKPPYKGIHLVYSGLNRVFKDYYNKWPDACLQELEKEGIIITKPTKGGRMIYLSGDEPANMPANEVLAKILKEES